MKTIRITIALLLFSLSLQAKGVLTGKIIDSGDNSTIPGAYVFVTGTQIAAITNYNGEFELQNIPLNTNIELVVSHVSYLNRKIPYELKTNAATINIEIRPKATQLSEVIVSEKKDKKWQKQLKKFKNSFLGTSTMGKASDILNPWVLQFKSEGTTLNASTDSLIRIENNGTGYKIKFLLDVFQQQGLLSVYGGQPIFEELSFDNSTKKQRWEANRKKLFLGSQRHFFLALINKKLKEEGFKVYAANFDARQQLFESGKQLNEDLLIQKSTDGNTHIQFNNFLKIQYTKQKPESIYLQENFGATSATGLAVGDRSHFNSQVSYISAKKNLLIIQHNGTLQNQKSLTQLGYWAWQKVGDMLPTEYLPSGWHIDRTNTTKGNQYPTKNGFVLKELSIPINEIKGGGPKKDGIPSIDTPKYLTVSEAEYLNNNDYVLGIELNGIAKAWPIRILNWHEIVNDTIYDTSICVTFCPLCGSGMIFSTNSKDSKPLSFGVSGLLYNSDMLLYDRTTGSLWSQIKQEAISGDLVGEKLTLLPSQLTTWKDWKTQYPSTLVLSNRTGFNRDYSRTPYEGYDTSNKLFFPVNQENNELDRKEKVVGIQLGDTFKAYPLSILKKKKNIIEDVIEGNKIIIKLNKSENSATITDNNGQLIPSTTLFWFAWYAFHPDTEVYE